jgi:NAD/NADP transhydrogenase beta subunit
VAANASPQQPNTLGKASLILGIASISLVFGLGLCGLVGGAQVPVFVTLLFVCAASSAFLGFIGAITDNARVLLSAWSWVWALSACSWLSSTRCRELSEATILS